MARALQSFAVALPLVACSYQEPTPSASATPLVEERDPRDVEGEPEAGEERVETSSAPASRAEDADEAADAIELPGPTGPPPEPWSMQSSSSYNRHFRGGADGEHLEATLKIEFAPGGAVTIVEDGAHRESRLSNRWGYRKRLRVWKTTWAGRWSDQGGRVQIVARPQTRDCVQREREADRPEQRRACDDAPDQVELECEQVHERVRPRLRDLDAQAVETALWSCAVTAGEGTLDTRSPWRLRPGCVRVSTGVRRRVSYGGCEDDAARPDESF